MAKQELQTKGKNELSKNELFNQNYTGHENMDSKSLSMCFLRIAQDKTPQIMKREASYIEGMEAGDFFSPQLSKNYGNKIKVILLGNFRSYVEWLPERGGFVRNISVLEFEKEIQKTCTIDKESKAKYITPEDHVIMETQNLFIMLADHPQDGILLYPLVSLGLTHSKRWFTKMLTVFSPFDKTKKAPTFAQIWEMKSTLDHRTSGDSFQLGDKKTTCIDFVDFVEEKNLVSAVMVALPLAQEYLNQVTNINYSGSDIKSDAQNEGEETAF